MTGDRTKAEIAACLAEILSGLARLARDQKLTQLHVVLETATKQAELDATNERKALSRKHKVA